MKLYESEKNMKQQINIAANIYKLRKKKGLTQSELAEKLYVCNKTVSKWERGAGYPEITQLTSLAKILDTTVDNLLLGEKYGIAIAGNAHTDNFKVINNYPKSGMLSTIDNISRTIGGCVPRTSIALATIDRELPISAIGKIGNDDSGRYVLSELQKYNIDTSKLVISSNESTGFSDVMSDSNSGECTFFHYGGTNNTFSPEDIPVKLLDCRMLHIGYIILLKEFDKNDSECGTVMAKFLKSVQEVGIKTSIDITSNSTERITEKVIPSLKYTDNAILNEEELSQLSKIPLRDIFGKLILQNVKTAMETILSFGVAERVIVHTNEADFLLNYNGEHFSLPSLKTSVSQDPFLLGEAEAFTAGCLYGIYKGYDDMKILEFASGASVCITNYNNRSSNSKTKEAIFEFLKTAERNNL